jgi:hypothetical protein
MKTYKTKKDRQKIYLEAAGLIGNIEYCEEYSCCPTIAIVVWGWNDYKRVTKISFPEFYLFNPENELIGIHDSWWNNKKEGLEIAKNIRRTALLLAAEMCN